MDAFPVAPELMQAFPLGALSLLVTVASTVAAQHGVEAARSICNQLAGNDELWSFIARRMARQPATVDSGESDTQHEMTVLLGDSMPPVPVASENEAPRPLPEENDGPDNANALSPESQTSAGLAKIRRESAAGARPSKVKRRRRQKASGVVR
jgi:hypothetical protein